MNVLFTRISTISLILFVCVCNVLEVKANKEDEWFLLEAKLSKKTARAVSPQPASPVQVDMMGSKVTLVFSQQLGQVTIKICNEQMNPVYVGYSTNPQSETISTTTWKKGLYTVQVIAGSSTYVEYVYVE